VFFPALHSRRTCFSLTSDEETISSCHS
jgi:hypothetical protein